MKTLLRLRYAALFGVLLIAGFALAQYQPQDPYQYDDQYQDNYPDQYQDQNPYSGQDPAPDPPGRVARLQYVRGGASLQPGGVDQWVDANLNRPLTTADRIWVDRNSRLELSIGSAVLRLSDESSMQFLNLTDDTAQIELDQGTLHLSVRYLDENEIVEVDTPNVAFIVYEPGEYRFDVWPRSDETSIEIRRGEGEANGRDTSMVLYSGNRYLFRNGQSLRYQVARLHRPDNFDRWCEQREREQESSPSAQYVARGTIGYEALDAYGVWQPTSVYGTVWFPSVYAGWAPYRYGHWAWIEPWGWTWVDDAPWGFAPFHYGRWAYIHGRWGWIPGPVAVRPVYAPALVAWVGGTPGFGVSIGVGIGGVGWVPLGWRDPYIPYYHVSPYYARRVNLANSRVVNVTVINNYYGTRNVRVRERTISGIRYENARVRGAMTAVSGDVFSSGRPVGKGAVIVSPQHADRVRFSAEATVVPTKEAVLGGRRPVGAPKGWVIPPRVVAKTPPPPPPVSFERQRPMLEKSKGVPLTWEERSRMRSSTPEPAVRKGRPIEVIPAPGGQERGRRQKGAPGTATGVQPEQPPAGSPPAREARPQSAPERREPAPDHRPEWLQPPRPQTRPEAQPEARPETRPETRPEARPDRRGAAPESRPETRPQAAPEAMPEAAPGRRPGSQGVFQGVQPSQPQPGGKVSQPASPSNESPERTMRPPTVPEQREAAPPPSRPAPPTASPSAPRSGARETAPAPPASEPAVHTGRPSSAPPARETARPSQGRTQAEPGDRKGGKGEAGKNHSHENRAEDSQGDSGRGYGSREH